MERAKTCTEIGKTLCEGHFKKVAGIKNTVGRVAVGFFSDFTWVNTLLVHNIAMLCSGVVCILKMFASTYPLMCVFADSFGLCIGKQSFSRHKAR